MGASATTMSATITPTGFRASVGVYQGGFLPGQPVANCRGTTTGASSGAPVTFSTPVNALLPGFTEQTFYFVISGATASDVGSFSA